MKGLFALLVLLFAGILVMSGISSPTPAFHAMPNMLAVGNMLNVAWAGPVAVGATLIAAKLFSKLAKE